jgi:hypothetical protein
MVVPVPAQISKLRPRLPASRRCFRPPLLTTHHSLPTLLTKQLPACPPWRASSPSYAPRNARIASTLNNLRILPVATEVYPLRPLCSALRALCVALFPSFERSSTPTLLFASAWSLFVVSLRTFLHSFPLFSIVCSLFSENTGGGVSVKSPGSSAATWTRRAHPTIIAVSSRVQVHG